jgi:hypothetical protein
MAKQGGTEQAEPASGSRIQSFKFQRWWKITLCKYAVDLQRIKNGSNYCITHCFLTARTTDLAHWQVTQRLHLLYL